MLFLNEELEAHVGPDDDAGVSGVHGHGRPGADLPVPRGTPPLRVLQRPPPRLPAVRPRAHERQKQDRRGARRKTAGRLFFESAVSGVLVHLMYYLVSLPENAWRRGDRTRVPALPLTRHFRVRAAEGSQVAPGQSCLPDQVISRFTYTRLHSCVTSEILHSTRIENASPDLGMDLAPPAVVGASPSRETTTTS